MRFGKDSVGSGLKRGVCIRFSFLHVMFLSFLMQELR